MNYFHSKSLPLFDLIPVFIQIAAPSCSCRSKEELKNQKKRGNRIYCFSYLAVFFHAPLIDIICFLLLLLGSFSKWKNCKKLKSKANDKKALFVVFKWNVIIVDVKKNIANICHYRKIINIIITFSASYWKQKNSYSTVYEQLIESFHTLRVLVRPLSSIKSREVGALLMNCFSSCPICPWLPWWCSATLCRFYWFNLKLWKKSPMIPWNQEIFY